MYRRVFTALAIGLIVGTVQSFAFASSDIGGASVRINARDASTGMTIALTNVTIYGPRNLQAVADFSGQAQFMALPAGKYSIEIGRYGYTPTKIAPIELTDGENLVLDVRLVPTGLKIIATVTARKTPKVPMGALTSDDTPVQLQNSLIASLASLAAITLGPNAAASIRGRPPTQVGVTIDGVPVSLFGSPPNIGALNADLFSSASIDPSDASGSAGGTVDFATRSPTLAWLGAVREIAMNHNGGDFAVSEEGTAGVLGVSYTHAQRTSPDPLDGLTYVDTSGLTYPHVTADKVNGDALELRYPLSQRNVLSASAVSINALQPLVCRYFTGQLPCGYGPTNNQQTRLRTAQVRDTTRLGEGWLTTTLFSSSMRLDVDQSGFYANGVHEPSSSTATARTSGVLVHGGFPLSQRRTRNAELKAMAFSQSTTSLGDAFGPVEPALLSRLSFANVVLTAPLVTTHRFSSSLHLGAERWQSGNVNASAHTGLSFSYALTDRDAVSFDATSGTATAPTAAFAGVSPATMLQFNCEANVALGTGPSQGTGGSRSFETHLDWKHSASRWSAELDLYNQVQTHAPITAVVGANDIDPSFFPKDYLLQATEAQRNACGANTPLNFTRLFYTVSGIAEHAQYRGADLSVVASASQHVALRLSYALTGATAYGNNSLLFGPFSTVLAGKQLPQVPLHTADLSAAADVGHGGLKALFEASAVSSNNAYDLPGYVTINAGMLIPTQRGVLAVTVANLANRYPGPFATAAHAVALPMAVGAFPTVAQPLSPRTISIGYRVNVGPPQYQPAFGIDETQFEPNYSGVGGGSWVPPFIGRPQPRPFAVNPQSPACGPEDVRTAQRLLASIQTYVRRVEHARTSAGYPQSFPSEPVGALVLEYSRVGESYAVIIATGPGDTNDLNADILPIEDCGFAYAVTKDQAESSQLYMTPKSGAWIGPGHAGGVLLAYMPAVGLYAPPVAFEETKPAPSRPKIENAHFWDYIDPPGAIPSDPFSIRRGAYCSAEVEPAATDVLNALRKYAHAYFDLHQRPADPPELRIVAHKSPGGTWLEIRSEDLQALSNLTPCMNVFEMSRKAIQEAGYSGELPPELSYAPHFGLYVVDR